MIHWWKALFQHKKVPQALASSAWTGTGFVDSFKRNRNPTPNELLAELKGIAASCATINAAACANAPPALYVVTKHNQPKPKCGVKSITPNKEDALRQKTHLQPYVKGAARIEEVTDHPLLDVLGRPNQFMGPFDLWELTSLYLETIGQAFWVMDMDDFLGTPTAFWLLPAQNVTAKRDQGSGNPVDYYEYKTGKSYQRFEAWEVIHFRFPDPRDPYNGGLSPLRSAFEQVSVSSDYSAYKKARFENHAVPDAIISPDEVLGEEERDRLETQWNMRFRRGGSGRVIVAESGLKVNLLNQSMGDAAALAEMGATKEMIANAFHVPIAFFTSNTNLANLIGSRSLHSEQAIGPRLRRRDELLNFKLLPLFDTSGRLFLASEAPNPVDSTAQAAMQEMNLKYGVLSINEHRAGLGMPPVPWGELPWLSTRWAPTDVPRIIPGPAELPQQQEN